MLIHPRVAIATGLAAAAGAVFLLIGRIEGSILLAAVLAVGARAAALAASPEPAAAAALARQTAVAPVWLGVAFVTAMRAGGIGMDSIRGTHAVAGVAAVRGDAAMVTAVWLAAIAGIVALLVPAARGAIVVADQPAVRLEAIGVALQGSMIVVLLAAPQVGEPADLVPWVIAAAGAVVAAAAGLRLRMHPKAGVVAVLVAALAVVLASSGSAP